MVFASQVNVVRARLHDCIEHGFGGIRVGPGNMQHNLEVLEHLDQIVVIVLQRQHNVVVS